MGMTGGPGYASTQTAPDYEHLWGEQLMLTRDTVTVDQRGTGCSGAINCPSVQLSSRLTVDNVTACGEVLGNRSDLYGMSEVSSSLCILWHPCTMNVLFL